MKTAHVRKHLWATSCTGRLIAGGRMQYTAKWASKTDGGSAPRVLAKRVLDTFRFPGILEYGVRVQWIATITPERMRRIGDNVFVNYVTFTLPIEAQLA